MVHSRHSVLVALVVTTVVITAAVSWAGWRLIQQQRAIDRQRTQEQLGATADSMAATIRGRLAETGERLSQATTNPEAPPVIAGAVGLTFQTDGTVTGATGGLPFVPSVPDTAAADALFEDAEVLEFARADLAAASSRYHALISHGDATVRAGALVRYARVAEKRGDTAAALEAYRQLEHSGDVRFKHLPARFIGLYQQHAIAKVRGDADRERSLAATLTQGLDAGEWRLTRDAAAWYRDQLGMQHVPGTWALAEAVERVWQADGTAMPPRGQRVFNDGARSVLVMWRAGRSATAMMTAYFDEFLPAFASSVTWHLADPAGRWIAGERSVPGGAATPRVVGDSEYAWMLHVGGGGTTPALRGEQTIVAMIAAMLAFLWGAMYFMARALRRESAVARLQTDFVAAVSHEFRSPLTTIRQMAEMLEADRVPSTERRREYYQVLAAEATRLQRLVETLLNFGRMEAGAARYRLDEIELSDVVRRVVSDSEPAARESGKHIMANGPDSGVLVRADGNALALAIRNLIDNAVKYSPGQPEVRVEWGEHDGRALLRVIDRGIGIPRAEQQTIFDKFVRGRSAVDANVAGTGVGLAMVRQILRALGGDVAVESEVGRGSTFTLDLPLVNSQVATPKSRLVQETTEARS